MDDPSNQLPTIRESTSDPQFLSAVLDNAGTLLLVVDSQGQIIRFNRQCEQLSGYTQAEVRGKLLWDVLLTTDSAASTQRAFQQLNVQHFPRTYEGQWLNKDGSVRLIAWTETAILSAQSTLEYITMVGSDITQSRAVENQLRASEAELRALISAMSDVILIINAEGRYLEIAPTNPKLLYRPPDELLGKRMHDIMPGDQADFFLAYVQHALQSGHTQSVEYNLPIGDEKIWFSASISPMTEDKVVWVARDITEHKQAEAEREAMIHDLSEASRVKDEFLANISHELRTPLNAIIGMIGIMLMGGSLDERNTRLAQRARVNSERLLTLINDILDISRIETGRVEIRPTTFAVQKFIERVSQQFVLPAEQKGLQLNINVDETVPALVTLDEDALDKIVNNLLSNAIKFTQVGSISLRLSHDDSNLKIEVSDTGIGIPAYMHELIFENFRQGDGSSTRTYGGTGLGLAIVRHLCAAMQGSVYVESTPDQGSKFIVTLPLRTDSTVN
jgi:PAS domain S-box-containing protein